MKPTKNMQAFMDANKESPVYFGAQRFGGVFYKLETKEEFFLTNQDIKSAPDFMPDWRFKE